MPLKGETVLEIFDVMLKAAYLGLTGVGMPLAVLAYLIYGSLKCGTRTGGLLFSGHLLVSVLAGGVVFLGGGWIFESSARRRFSEFRKGRGRRCGGRQPVGIRIP